MKTKYDTPEISVLMLACDVVVTSSTQGGLQNGGTANADSNSGSADWGDLFG